MTSKMQPEWHVPLLRPDEQAEWVAAHEEIARLKHRIKLLEARNYRRSRGKQRIAELRAAMIAAHPDKGGSHDAFIAAHRAYVRARSAGAAR
jgi:hypothetical protein